MEFLLQPPVEGLRHQGMLPKKSPAETVSENLVLLGFCPSRFTCVIQCKVDKAKADNVQSQVVLRRIHRSSLCFSHISLVLPAAR